ncbi:MAG: hypothetical protein ACJ731_05560 [Vicinamibacterales bacterium]
MATPRLDYVQAFPCGFETMRGLEQAVRRSDLDQRLHVLAAWDDAPFYSARERAALAWCEALTCLPEAVGDYRWPFETDAGGPA